MKQLKLIGLLTVVVMLLGMVAACGGAPAAPATQPTAAPQATTAPVQPQATEAPKPTEAPAATTAPAETAKKFKIATDATFPPMEFVDASKTLTGFDVELLKAIGTDQKFDVEFQNVAWDGIFAGLEAGQYDAIMSSVTVTDDRKAKYDFSDPYFNANQVIVVPADNTDITGPDSLKGKRIGTQIQTTGTYALEKLGLKSKEYDSPDLGMQDMVNGNLDAFVVDTPVAANFALQSEQFKGKLKLVGAIPTNEVYAFTVQKGDPKGLLPLFNSGLADVKKAGDYDKLYVKYIGQAPEAAAGGAAAAAATAAPAAGNQAVVTDTSYAAANCDYGGELKSIEAVDGSTVKFTLCTSDVAFPSKVAFTPFQIQSAKYLDQTGGGGQLVEQPLGTGPYMLDNWQKGDSIILKKNPNYNGPNKVYADQVIIKWNKEAAARLLELQAGTVDGIDNPDPPAFDQIAADTNLKLYPRAALNIFYLGFNNTKPPFDNEKVRQAIAMGIDRKRIVDNFYPKGSSEAEYFTPCDILGGCEGDPWYKFDPVAAKKLLADAGFPNGFDTDLSYRSVVRGYLPQPDQVAQDIQAQLKENLGINVTLNVMESTAFIDASQKGQVGLHLLGWGADYPDQTDFLDYHFGKGATEQFGKTFPDLVDVLNKAATSIDPEARKKLYAQANDLVKQHVPMVPVAHGGSATVFKADVKGAHASPLTNEYFAVMDPAGRKQLVFSQNAEPGGIYCADETDGESLRVCEQIGEALLSYKIGGTDVEAGLADMPKSNADLTEWTFTLRKDAKFSDGTPVTAKDVIATFAAQWDAKHPDHKGRTGDFAYFSTLFGAFLNAPPAK